MGLPSGVEDAPPQWSLWEKPCPAIHPPLKAPETSLIPARPLSPSPSSVMMPSHSHANTRRERESAGEELGWGRDDNWPHWFFLLFHCWLDCHIDVMCKSSGQGYLSGMNSWECKISSFEFRGNLIYHDFLWVNRTFLYFIVTCFISKETTILT
jgi:hypothetical protein